MDVRFVFCILIHAAILGGCTSSQTEGGNPPNAPPQISGVPPTSVVAGDAYSFTPTASDPDDDPLEFSIIGRPNWTTFDTLLGALAGMPSDGDVGVSDEIRISVSDGTESISLPVFTVTVDSASGDPPPPDPDPAGFVGFGSITQGADSCPTTAETYRVTSLSGQSGQGTLRDAVSQGCRLIVFDIGGDIDIGDLQISESYLTIAGSTAPAPGITLINVGRLVLEARNSQPVHDVVVENIRAVGLQVEIESNDLWELDGSSGAPIYNVVLDHLTMQASGDGNVDIYGDVHDVTLSNSLIRDTHQGHHFSQSGGRRERLTIYGNVYAQLNERQPRVRHNTLQLDFVNNVIYGWGWIEGGAAGFHIAAGVGTPTANVENNIYHYVSGLNGGPDDALKIDEFAGTWHFEGNDWPLGETQGDSTSNSTRISMDGFEVERRPTNELDVNRAGTHLPSAEEQMLLAEISVAIAE